MAERFVARQFSTGRVAIGRSWPAIVVLLTVLQVAGCAQPRPLTDQERVQRLRADLLQRRAQALARARQAGEKIETAEYKEAQSLLNEALLLDPHSFATHTNLGVLYLRQRRYYEAAQSLRHAATLAPGSVLPYYNLGLLLEQTGRWQEACRQYELALERDGDFLPAIEQLAQCYMRLDRHPERVRSLLDQAARMEYRPEWLEWLAVQRSTTNAAASAPATSAAGGGS